MRGFMVIVATGTLLWAGAYPSSLAAETRVVVNPRSSAAGTPTGAAAVKRLDQLRAQRSVVEASMQSEWANFKAVRGFKDEWIKACNRRTAAEFSIWLGNQAWNKVAANRAPPVIKGALKAEDWLGWVQWTFGSPPDLVQFVGKNFQCRAEVTEAYAGYYTRLKGLGETLRNIERETAQIEQAIAGQQNRPSKPPLSVPSINPEWKVCDGSVVTRCNSQEASEEYYSCMRIDTFSHGRNRNLSRRGAAELMEKLYEVEEYRCFRLRGSEEWFSISKIVD